ncbi:MAG TPA: chromate transporter [Candidatus Acidoferrales bacterium]|nr:chromate transporter [Candidatus Acidoferrales bacterium]
MNKPSRSEIFLVFLRIGAISFGGGVVAYLRDSLVRTKKWFDDVEFLEMTSISNTLPGLNATNMAILAGDRLGGTIGSIGAMLGMCLPAFIFMTASGILYASHAERPLVDAALRGVAAAATGMIAATWYQIGRKSLHGFYDALFVLSAVVGIHYFHLSVPVVLVCVGAAAIFTYRPQPPKPAAAPTEEEWERYLH